MNNTVDLLLLQMDQLWDNDWETLIPTLKGVSDEEASWVAPCYLADPGEVIAGQPPTASIWWHLHHLSCCKLGYMAQADEALRGSMGRGQAELPVAADNYAEELKRLIEIRNQERAQVAGMSESDLDLPMENGRVIAGFITTTMRHDVWHAAQIALVRRLWRTRSAVQ